MAELFQNKYRIPSARLPGWDYSTPGAYYVTICTKFRICWFGSVHNKKMSLSAIGKTADMFWHEIPEHVKNVKLDEFVVMPNHIHGIVIITDENGNWTFPKMSLRNRANTLHAVDVNVETLHATSLPDSRIPIPPKPGSLSAIMRSYKSAVTNWARKNQYPNFGWQERFHDHIIRNNRQFQRIKYYIKHNPEKWIDDRFHSDCL